MLQPVGSLARIAALCAVSTFSVCAADAPPAPARENPIAKVLPWVGAPGPETPKHLILKKGDAIVAIGDSITQAGGYLRDIDAALAGLQPALQLLPIVNVGISGQKAEDLVGRFQNDVVDRKPAVVTLSIGINDVWHRLGAAHDEKVLKAYTANVTKMVAMAQAAGIKIILLTPTVIQEDPATEGNKRLAPYVDALKALAREQKCGLADLHAMFLEALKHKPADVKGNWLTTDGVHMNALGDAIMAAGVLRALGVSDQELAKAK
jgi:lysophospholipase L1-like esterase